MAGYEVIKMSEIPRSYLRLFNCITDAIELIDNMNFGLAKDELKEGQSQAEELYLAENEGELTDEKKIEIFLKTARDEAKEEKELAAQEADKRIDDKIAEWREKIEKTANS